MPRRRRRSTQTAHGLGEQPPLPSRITRERRRNLWVMRALVAVAGAVALLFAIWIASRMM